MQTVEAGQAHATTSDGAQVIIHLKQPAVETEYVEFAGTVEAPNQLRETDRAYFGGKFGARMQHPALAVIIWSMHASSFNQFLLYLSAPAQLRVTACTLQLAHMCITVVGSNAVMQQCPMQVARLPCCGVADT